MTITSFIARSTIAVAGSALLVAAAVAPAMAATHPATPHAGGVTQKIEVQKDSKGKVRYCANMPAVTGSILSGRTCMTAKQWKNQGVDIEAAVAAAQQNNGG